MTIPENIQQIELRTFKSQAIFNIENPIEALDQLTYRYQHTAQRVRRMLLSLYTTGFAAFG